MTHHGEWFCKYERYDGNDVFLGDDSMTRIIGWWKSSWSPWVEGLEKCLIFCTSQDWLEIWYEWCMCKNNVWKWHMKDGLRRNGTVEGILDCKFKLLGSIVSDGWYSFVIHKSGT